MTRLTLAAALLATALPAVAQYGTGSVTGTLDLDPAVWIVAGDETEPGSLFRDTGGEREIRIVATPEAGRVDRSGTLIITITAEIGATEAEVVSATVAMRGDEQNYIATDENVDMSITAMESQGSDMAVSGSFQATMTPDGAEGLVISPEEGRVVDGNFQATIPRASEESDGGSESESAG